MSEPETEANPANDLPSGGSTEPATKKRKKKNRFAAFVRWLHIYVSMLGLAVTFFFSVTGITLNHADWFFTDTENANTIEGTLDESLMKDLRNPESTTAKLNTAEFLRAEHRLGGAVKEFSVDEFQSMISFAGPGYSADVFIDNETSQYEITEVQQGFIAIINDLHKGRDTGTAWSWVIDISAVVLCIISGSGLLLLFWLRRRRMTGLITMAVGTIVVVAIYWWAVP